LIDANGGLLNRPKRASTGDGSDASDAALDYRKGVERDLQTKIAATLEPLLGAEHFRVGVSADVDLTSGDQSEEVFDPQKSVMLTSQTTEDGPALPAASGVPGTASSLPRPTSKPTTGSSNYARRTENVSYQTSRVVKHTKLPQGSVKRLSLSVLVDHGLRFEAGKRVVEAPSPEKLKVIHDLVAASTGLNTERGDQLVVEAFPFESTLSAEPVVLAAPGPPVPVVSPLPPWLQKLTGGKNFTIIAGIGGGAVVVLIGGVIFALRKGGNKKASAQVAAAAIAAAQAAKNVGPTPAEMQHQIEGQMAEQASLHARKQAEELMKLKIPEVSTKKTEVLTKHIASESKKDPAVMAQVVRSWLNGQDQR
jgi:flagellar M-ring protein FliF